MTTYIGTCLLSQQQLIDEYFMEIRAKILDVAAFLDRFDRSITPNATDDFRIVAMREALVALTSNELGRVLAVQMIFSDPTTELRSELDRKSAYGAFPQKRVRTSKGKTK